MRSSLVAEIRQLRLALRLIAGDIDVGCQSRRRWCVTEPQLKDVITIEMFRNAAEHLRRLDHEEGEDVIRRHLAWMLRDFKRTAEIRRAQVALADGEPAWSLRPEAGRTALRTEVEIYEKVIQQFESILGHESELQELAGSM